MKPQSLRSLGCTTALLACALLTPTLATAQSSFSDVVFFGDSLTDTGNRVELLGQTGVNNAPYFGGRDSNGLLWSELLATGLGIGGAARASLLGGNNYAYGGATTGFDASDTGYTIPSMQSQIGLWGATHATADAGALYVLVGGHNDARYAAITYSGTDAASQSARQAVADAAIGNLKASLSVLAAKGAQHVLVSNLMDLGNTFAVVQLGKADAAHDASLRFNAMAQSLETYGDALGMHVDFLDLNGVLTDIRNDALNNAAARYGINNIDRPCAGFEGSLGAACNVSLYSDDVHPSAHTNEIIAQAAFRTLGVSPVPEPESYALLLAGLSLMGGIARRRKQK